MWTLLLITVLSKEPPRIRYEPYARFTSKEECVNMGNIIKKQLAKDVQIHCVYDKG